MKPGVQFTNVHAQHFRQALRDYEPSLLANEQVALEAAVCRVEADLVLREAS